MKNVFVRAALVFCMSVSLFAVDARAQQVLIPRDTFGRPNAWEIAKQPKILGAFVVHAEVRQALLRADQAKHGDAESPPNPMLAEAILARAHILLADAIAYDPTDARLQLDLGEVLYEEEGRNEAAELVLGTALAEHPNADGAHSAWLTYAFANSKLDHPEDECLGYERFLAEEPNPSRRLVPLLNLAEANMRSHRLSESIEGYRDVENLSASVMGSTETGVLAVWGLAIALDRQGDARGAADQARIVSRMDPESPLRLKRAIIDSDAVYFVPAYEKFWYLALAATEDAKQAGSAEESAREWAHAVALWQSYIEPAQKIEHPEAWNVIATRHLAAAEKQLKIAEIRAKSEAKNKNPATRRSLFSTRDRKQRLTLAMAYVSQD